MTSLERNLETERKHLIVYTALSIRSNDLIRILGRLAVEVIADIALALCVCITVIVVILLVEDDLHVLCRIIVETYGICLAATSEDVGVCHFVREKFTCVEVSILITESDLEMAPRVL